MHKVLLYMICMCIHSQCASLMTEMEKSELCLCSASFNPPSRHLSPVQASQRDCRGLVRGLLHLHIRSRQDYFHVCGMTLERVNTTMGTVCATAGFLCVKELGGNIWSMNDDIRTGACCTTMFLMKRSSSSRFLASAFDSAFFNRRRINLTDFSGQRPIKMCKYYLCSIMLVM